VHHVGLTILNNLFQFFWLNGLVMFFTLPLNQHNNWTSTRNTSLRTDNYLNTPRICLKGLREFDFFQWRSNCCWKWKPTTTLSNKAGYYIRQGSFQLLCAMRSNKKFLQRKAVNAHVIPVRCFQQTFQTDLRFTQLWFLPGHSITAACWSNHYDISQYQWLFTNRHVTWLKTWDLHHAACPSIRL
jgi:hypothetical protein